MAYHIGDRTPFVPSTEKIIQNFSNFQYYHITKKEKEKEKEKFRNTTKFHSIYDINYRRKNKIFLFP